MEIGVSRCGDDEGWDIYSFFMFRMYVFVRMLYSYKFFSGFSCYVESFFYLGGLRVEY